MSTQVVKNKFTARHYSTIADTISQLPDDIRPVVARVFCDMLSTDNPQQGSYGFKPATFLDRCRVEYKVVQAETQKEG